MKSSLYIVWHDDNSLGVPIIDEQHRGIISSINSLHYFIQTGRADEILKPTLSMLNYYTKVHFSTEETLMAEAEYPALDEHFRLHKELIKKMENVSREAALYYKDANILLEFLREWWLDHINKEDRKYAPFLTKLIEK